MAEYLRSEHRKDEKPSSEQPNTLRSFYEGATFFPGLFIAFPTIWERRIKPNLDKSSEEAYPFKEDRNAANFGSAFTTAVMSSITYLYVLDAFDELLRHPEYLLAPVATNVISACYESWKNRREHVERNLTKYDFLK